MNPQAGPSSQKPTVVKHVGDGIPDIVNTPLPLRDQITIYFTHFGAKPLDLQRIVYVKTRRETGFQGDLHCNEAEQKRIIEDAMSEFEKNKWDWKAANVGRYLASGLTQISDLNLVTEFEEDASVLWDLRKPLNPTLLTRLRGKKEEIYDGAWERFLENRHHFPEETKIADDLRKIKLSLDAPPPLTADQLAAHWDAAGLAALDIIVKKE